MEEETIVPVMEEEIVPYQDENVEPENNDKEARTPGDSKTDGYTDIEPLTGTGQPDNSANNNLYIFSGVTLLLIVCVVVFVLIKNKTKLFKTK